MKKLKNLILGIVMAVTLSACNSANEIPTQQTPTAAPTPTQTATQTVEPTVEFTTSTNETVTEKTNAADTETVYIGNKNSKKFHRPDCHTLPAEKNRAILSSRDEAINSGYSPCGNCQP